MAHRLITIPISHYCEKARWALERAGIPYTEERHLQGLHRRAARRAGRGRAVPALLAPHRAARRAGGGRTVPVLVAPDRVLGESAAIVAYADERMPPERRLGLERAE